MDETRFEEWSKSLGRFATRRAALAAAAGGGIAALLNAVGLETAAKKKKGKNKKKPPAGPGDLIAFTRFVGSDTKVFAMSSQGESKPKGKRGKKTKARTARRVTTGAGSDTHPVVSPDGSKIAFERGEDIWVVDASGGNETNLTNSAATERGAAWSPDGTKIAFSRDGDVWVMDADGGNPTPLNTDVFSNQLDWSPDGTKIAYEDLSLTSGYEIAVMDADGSDPVVLTNGDTNAFHPEWSPDSSQIAFTFSSDIWVMDADGENAARVTTTAGVFETTPTWSPDGSQLLFERNGALLVMNATGGPTRQLNKGFAVGFQPDWQDGP